MIRPVSIAGRCTSPARSLQGCSVHSLQPKRGCLHTADVMFVAMSLQHKKYCFVAKGAETSSS